MMELVLARHGQSYGNLDRFLRPDTELTERGRQQAAQLGEWLARQGYGFRVLYCNPLQYLNRQEHLVRDAQTPRAGQVATRS